MLNMPSVLSFVNIMLASGHNCFWVNGGLIESGLYKSRTQTKSCRQADCFVRMLHICYLGFATLDVVCDELNDYAWNLGLLQLSDKCVYVYCVESFAHIESYSDCSHRGGWEHLLEPLCYCVF